MTERTPHAILVEIADQLRLLHQHCRDNTIDPALVAYERAEAATRTFLTIDLPDDRGPLEDLLADSLDSLETDARETFSDSTLDDLQVTRTTAVLRARCTVLRLIARKLHDRPARDELPFLFAELRELEQYSRTLDADAAHALRAARSEAVVVRAAHVLKRGLAVKNPSAATDVELAFDLTRAMERAERGLVKIENDAAQGAAARELLTAIRTERERLTSGYVSWTEMAVSPADREVALRLGSVLAGEIDNARISALDIGAPSSDAPDVEGLVADGERMQSALEKLRKSSNPEGARAQARLRRAPRRLRRLIRRLRDTQSDAVLRRRLERVFRPRVVRVWEAFVFWMIVSVLGLIVVEHYTEPDMSAGIPWTVWVDTFICGILLLDFGTRLALTPKRGRYFYRHFLTEFLPALPLGLMAAMAEHPSVRSVRVLRLVRVFRILRLMQPVIRFVRLLLFVIRAADRIVERNAWFLNRNIVFFERDSAPSSDPPLVERTRDLDSWVQRTSRDRYSRVSPEVRTATMPWRSGILLTALRHREVMMPAPGEERRSQQADIDLETVIHLLRDLDDSKVADLVGSDLAWQITTSLRFIRLPVLRSLPGIRFVVGPTGSPDPLWFTARLGKVLGDLLDTTRRAITWFTDLHGTITGSQFLDRIGLQLVKATARPTKRLIMFTLLTIVLFGLVHLMRLEFLGTLMNSIVRFMLLPVSILGIVCAMPLLLGLWFRRIAGQAVDFFDRVADAQFLSLTEIGKQSFADQRLPELAERTLVPEAALIATLDHDQRNAIVSHLTGRACTGRETCSVEKAPTGLDWSRADFMLLFYRDFIDGAWFHRNDTKIANFLLGNLTLENIRQTRFQLSKAEQRRIGRLDIARGRGGILGPTPWFNFITHAVAQRTARLIIEYNQHCIPADELESADAEDREIFESWLTQREDISRLRRDNQPVPQCELSGSDGTLAYRTTEFHALHFLTVDTRRDDLVRTRYGERVQALLLEDRQLLIRQTFGTFPVHELPAHRRTFNPHEFYTRYISRGRVFLAPIVAAWLALRVLTLLLKRLIGIIRDVLDPDARTLAIESTIADFSVARRKLHRMRRPMVFEAVRMRARFDVEYLGLDLPGVGSTVALEHRLARDLRALDATEREWEEFRELKSRRQDQLESLERLLARNDLAGKALESRMVEQNSSLAGREAEAVRALVLAYTCDAKDVRSLIEARRHLRDWLSFLATGGDSDRAPKRGWPRPNVGNWVERAWPLIAEEDQRGDAELRKRFRQSIARGTRDDLRRLELLAGFTDREESASSEALDRFVIDTLLVEAEGPSSWTEQLIALRTVQSLGMIDLAGYEHAIETLGGYDCTEVIRQQADSRQL